MKIRMTRVLTLALLMLCAVLLTLEIPAQDPQNAGRGPSAPVAGRGAGGRAGGGRATPAQARVQAITNAANAFLDSLASPLRAKAILDLNDPKKATGWSNAPPAMYQRNGVRTGEMTSAQREAAYAVMKTALSPMGYQKVLNIIEADDAFVNHRGDTGIHGGKDNEYLAFFGTPSTTTPYGIQFGGHHLGINVTVGSGQTILTPTHTGERLAVVTVEGKDVRPLGNEYDKAVKLMAALDKSQQTEAILKYQIKDLVLGPKPDGPGDDKTLLPEGVRASRLNPAQQAMLLDVAGEWVNMLNEEGAAAKMEEVRRNIADTYFAWSGPTAPNSSFYYRIQGPTIFIEFTPLDWTGDTTRLEHFHTVYRDFTNNYGKKLMIP